MHPHKRRKASGAAAAPKPETPLSLYKQALRIVQQQPCGDVSADAAIQEKLTKAITLLEAQHAGEEQTVDHSLDLELSDEPLYLLASAHLQLGLLHQRQDSLDAAEQQFRAALRCFPRFVAGLSALGQVLKAAAASAASLAEAQQVLTQAVDIAQQVSETEGGLLVESNKGCAAELEAADAARAALAMLLCQSRRADEAAVHLTALGFKFRLSQEVLCYTVPKQPQQQKQLVAGVPGSTIRQEDQDQDQPVASSSSRCDFMQVVDAALPAPLLQHLQHVFRPGADFWREHNYGRVGYFSYFFPMGPAGSPSTTSMHQLAAHLQDLGRQYFPDLAEAQYAEFWAHSRRHSSGHQLHFDSDDEGQGGVRHPIITAIVYLSDNTSPAQRQPPVCPDSSNGAAGGANDSAGNGCCCGAGAGGSCVCAQQQQQQQWVGGPTLMTDQVLGGPLATQGWLAYPATNRVVFFDGRYLHGVIPGRGPTPSDGRRCTLMMAFWRDLKCRTQPGQGVGACMPMPDPAAVAEEQWVWQRELRPLEVVGSSAAATAVQELQHVSAVWQAVEGGRSTAGAAYQLCWQGF